MSSGPKDRVRTSLDAPAMLLQIQRMSELTTVKYSVQKVIGLEEAKFPVGTERILLVVQASVRAGIDLSQLKLEHVRILGEDRVLVQLPEPRVLQVAIDEKQTKVWDREVTWWTPWVPYNLDLERQARLAALKSVEETALEMGALEQARTNARQLIRGLLEQMGAKHVDFGSPLSLTEPRRALPVSGVLWPAPRDPWFA
jgi:hypothetical protein